MIWNSQIGKSERKERETGFSRVTVNAFTNLTEYAITILILAYPVAPLNSLNIYQDGVK